MTTTRTTSEFVLTAGETSYVARCLRRCWNALQERHKRARLRAVLHSLPDRLLRDIGISRSEIEYFVLNGSEEDLRQAPITAPCSASSQTEGRDLPPNEELENVKAQSANEAAQAARQ
jgi:uncharacterized protein YjiS (DUF1127 family)